PGGAILPFYDALSQSKLRHVLARHEQGAGFMAQGLARATGRAGVAVATSGPGIANLLTAIADAKADSVPLVCFSGQVPQALLGTDAFQEIAALDLARPITKAAWMARKPEDLLRLIPDAFRLALSGRPGPVLIDFPKDVQLATFAVEAWPEPGRAEAPPAPDSRRVAQAAELLAAAGRPLLYLGGGVTQAGAGGLALRLAEHLDAPIAQTLMGLGAVPPSHPLALGLMGMHAQPSTNLALEEADLLLVLGARFDDRATGKLAEFCPSARVIHVDIDPRELGKLRRPEVSIHAGAAEAIEALLRACPPQARPAWRARVAELRGRHGWPDGHQAPAALFQACAAALPHAVVSSDVGQHQMWAAQHYPFDRERQWLTSGGLGTMGFGLPAALGAALADPSRPALCISGDGSLLMNVQELATLGECGAWVKVLLLDNRSLGLVHQQQDLFYGGRRYASVYDAGPDWPALARAFGVAAVDLEGQADPAAALAAALRSPGPGLIRVPISDQAKVWPMVAPGGSNRAMLMGTEAKA
ncbi:MAG TPA: biosynthetic-type acetolactate synthase large subunit, partial [bacterium]|nr:biosynthetic-type acetolactate synthase large subunit [bacterium]